MSFWGELRRRNVFRVGLAYLAAAWLLLQAADLILSNFSAPSWVVQALIFAATLGFPFALVLAWHYEITPEGIKSGADIEPSRTVAFTGRRIDFLIIGLLVLAVAFLVVDTDDVVESSVEVLPNSIAVLPFENLSNDPDDAFFAAGMHEAIIARLGGLTDLSVISNTSVRRYEETDLSIPEIAQALNVETMMEGSLSYAEDRVRVTARLIDAVTDNQLWSQVYERQFADIFAIQTDIATNIAIALDATFTSAEQRRIERQPTDSLDAYELYLQSRALSVASVEDYERKLGLLERALALDADFSTAWAEKSAVLLGTGLFFGLDDRDPEVIKAEAEDAAMRAVELAPDSGVAHSALANVAEWKPDWIEAESLYREALEVGGEPGQYAFFLLAVGKAALARDYYLSVQELDPLNDTIAMFIAAANDSLGDARSAMAEYERIGAYSIFNQIITQLGTDDRLELIPRTGFPDHIMEIGDDNPDVALDELRALYAESDRTVQFLIISALAARFGDAEFSLRVMENALDWMPTQTFMLWRPVFSEVRALPRFKDVMSEHGLVDYWRQYGWPDFCQPIDSQEFECN